MATTKRGVVSTRLEDLSGRICYFSMFTLEVWTVRCGNVAASGRWRALSSVGERRSLVIHGLDGWELMNGPRRRASLIALRRGLDALVSSTFFSISLCIMLRVSLHALFSRERHSIICFTSKWLLFLVERCDISGVSEGFRACSRTLHPLGGRAWCFSIGVLRSHLTTGIPVSVIVNNGI